MLRPSAAHPLVATLPHLVGSGDCEYDGALNPARHEGGLR